MVAVVRRGLIAIAPFLSSFHGHIYKMSYTKLGRVVVAFACAKWPESGP
jgi:hypothetical protein